MNSLSSAISADFLHEFPVNQQVCYLNHAAVAPWPASASKAVADFAQENSLLGATGYLNWLDKEKSLREQIAGIIGTEHLNSVALVKNTSEALSVVAYGLDWQKDDLILISDDEFPSNRIIWESLAQKFGVRVEQLNIPMDNPEVNFLDAISGKTFHQKPKLISVSAVQYASGIRLNLAKLGKACKDNDVLFCVDAIQAVGAMPFECDDWHIDFAMADGHKWMLGPEGLGFFFVRQQHIETLNLYQYGWHMVEHAGNYDLKDWTPAKDAKRFECGSPNILATHALEASLSLLNKVGLDKVQQAIEENHEHLRQKLVELGAEILSPTKDQQRAGIITFRIPGKDSTDLYKALMTNKVICANRGGGVRFSPHFHTTKQVMDTAIEKLKGLLAE